jgi:hypothetical protein
MSQNPWKLWKLLLMRRCQLWILSQNSWQSAVLLLSQRCC